MHSKAFYEPETEAGYWRSIEPPQEERATAEHSVEVEAVSAKEAAEILTKAFQKGRRDVSRSGPSKRYEPDPVVFIGLQGIDVRRIESYSIEADGTTTFRFPAGGQVVLQKRDADRVMKRFYALREPLKPAEPAEKEVTMRLTVTTDASVLKLRSFERFTIKSAHLYCKTFELRTAPNKTGIKLMSNGEIAILEYETDKRTISIKTRFKKPPSQRFRGILTAYYGLVLHAIDARNMPFRLVSEQTDLPNLKVVSDWGRWAYDSVLEKFPKHLA